MTEQEFYNRLKRDGKNVELAKVTIEQFGDWEDFVEKVPDVCNHGIQNGFGGFIYYTETCKFFQDNRDAIMRYSEEFGVDTFSMFMSFNCMKSLETNASEIAKAIYTNEGDVAEQIQNCLAWYIGEEVCRWYYDMIVG